MFDVSDSVVGSSPWKPRLCHAGLMASNDSAVPRPAVTHSSRRSETCSSLPSSNGVPASTRRAWSSKEVAPPRRTCSSVALAIEMAWHAAAQVMTAKAA